MIDLSLLTTELLQKYGIVEWGYNESPIPQTFEQFSDWSKSEKSHPLKYLQDERADKRASLLSIYPEFQSSISFLFSYKPRKFSQDFKMGNYIFGFNGDDYHYVLRDYLEEIGKVLSADYKTVLDVEPVLERDLAVRSGLGWFGKNSMLINREHGSYFLIGSILLPFKASHKPTVEIDVDHCGSCTSCIDLCPTLAIDPVSRTLNASKCISTFTIEVFKDIEKAPSGYEKASEIFGCDICQDVCPWNRKTLMKAVDIEGEKGHMIEDFFFKRPLDIVINQLENMSNREFKKKFYGTSLERTGRVGVLKNLKPFLENASNMSGS